MSKPTMKNQSRSKPKPPAIEGPSPTEPWKSGKRFSVAARAAIQSMVIDPDFDIEAYHAKQVLPDRTSSLGSGSVLIDGGREEGRFDHDQKKRLTEPVEPAYHVFSRRQKWTVIWIIGAAGLFSGLSSNIYLPSLDVIAKDLNVSSALVSLTITSYLVVQGTSPIVWGFFSDSLGRRPIYIYSFAVYIFSNIFLSLSPNFPILLVFRGVQAAGSASTVSIGNSVIQDITLPSERGGFLSFYQAIRNFSIAVGPVIGGALAGSFGFRSVFVFLLILSTITLLVIAFCLPETMRNIAGNGTLKLRGIYQPLIWRFRKSPGCLMEPSDRQQPPKPKLKEFVATLALLTDKSILMSLIPGGIVYAIWSMVTASTTNLFKESFRLNELLLGLAFLPNGLGTIVGSTVAGKLMDRDFGYTEAQYRRNHGLTPDHPLPKKNLPTDFPIERARLRSIWPIMVLFVISTSSYGWTLAFPSFVAMRGSITLPLFLHFLIAVTSNAVFAINQTLVSDLCPGRGASSAAINNLVRCSLGAVGVAFIDQMISVISVGPAFLSLGFLAFTCLPFLLVEWIYALGWRIKKMGGTGYARK